MLNLQKILGAKNDADIVTKVVTMEKLRLCMVSNVRLQIYVKGTNYRRFRVTSKMSS